MVDRHFFCNVDEGIRYRVGCRGLFVFQAEDGIRDLVRSRGLGDVYKRQPFICVIPETTSFTYFKLIPIIIMKIPQISATANAVSYTHLTLPTSDLV